MKRILILGDKGTGKTTFMNVFLNKQFPEHEESTLGVEAGAKTIQFEDHSFVNLQVWDTPGEEEYSEMAYPFYSNCKIFILVLDRMRKQTIESLPQWLQKIQQNNPGRVNNVLIIMNRVPKVTFTDKKSQQFTKKALQQTYRKQLQLAQRNKFHITIKQIDLIEQREHMNKMYLHPYLHECLTEEIVTEAEEKRVDKCGGLNCREGGCSIM